MLRVVVNGKFILDEIIWTDYYNEIVKNYDQQITLIYKHERLLIF